MRVFIYKTVYWILHQGWIWSGISSELIKTNKNLPRYTNEQAHTKFVSIWNEKVRPDLSNYGLQEAGFNKQDFLNFLDKKEPSKMPEVIFTRSWYKSMQQISDSLPRLYKLWISAAYFHLSIVPLKLHVMIESYTMFWMNLFLSFGCLWMQKF